MKFKAFLSFLAFLLILFIIVPMFKLVSGADPGIINETIRDPEVTGSIFLTLRASLWATLFALFTGIPLAWIIARKDFPGKKILEGLIDLPVIIPHTAAGIALLSAWGRNSFFTKMTGLTIPGTEAAISIAMFFVSVPFLVNSVKNGLRLIDPRYEKTAVTLGATEAQTFFRITLPMIKKSIISGSIMMWGRGISEFGAVIILAYHPKTAPVLIFERFQNFGLKYAVPVTVLMVVISLIIFIITRMFDGRK